MRRIALALGIIFLILTFAGGGYVLLNHGQVSAGYTIIPALWTMICFGIYQKKNHQIKDSKDTEKKEVFE